MEKKEYLDLYKKMYLIRRFEESCGENYSKGFIRGFLHWKVDHKGHPSLES